MATLVSREVVTLRLPQLGDNKLFRHVVVSVVVVAFTDHFPIHPITTSRKAQISLGSLFTPTHTRSETGTAIN